MSVLALLMIVVVVWVLNSVRLLKEWERGVVFRSGRLLPAEKGPGLVWTWWPVDSLRLVSIRITSLELECEQVPLADGSLETVRYELFFRVADPIKLVKQGRLENYQAATATAVQAVVRQALTGGTLPLDIYARRDMVTAVLSKVNEETSEFGVRIEDVQVTDRRSPG